jgi:hypothetical protein
VRALSSGPPQWGSATMGCLRHVSSVVRTEAAGAVHTCRRCPPPPNHPPGLSQMRVSVSTVVLFLAFTIGPFATAAEWQTLFDGQSLAGWKSYKSDKIGDAWSVVDGTLHLSQGGGGDIMTEQTYTDFELKFASALSRLRFRVGRENGVRYRKPERPEGCFAFSVPDPLFQRMTQPELLPVTKH